MKPLPILALDSIVRNKNAVLLIKRLHDPYKGFWAFPGGRMDYGETPENGCLRELKEETNLTGKISRLVGVYGEPDRDPRKHTVSIVYVVDVPNLDELKAGDDAGEAEFFDLKAVLDDEFKLAFDHKKILLDYVKTTEK